MRFTTSKAAAVAVMRSSGAPSGSTGSTLSQYGRERIAGSAEMRLWRCVVPVRGRPQMMIGARTS